MWVIELLAFSSRTKPLRVQGRTLRLRSEQTGNPVRHCKKIVQRRNVNLLQEELKRQEECLETTDYLVGIVTWWHATGKNV